MELAKMQTAIKMKKLPRFNIYHLDQKGECHISKNITTSQLAGQISLITHSIGEVINIVPYYKQSNRPSLTLYDIKIIRKRQISTEQYYKEKGY